MIGIPQRLVPKDRRRRVVLCVVSLLATLVAAVWYAIVSIRLEFGGERHVEMDKNIAASLLDSSAVGLERFRAQRGHYPQVSGKYFFDSIKTMVHVPEVYIYADSMTTEGRMVPLRISRGKRFPYEQVPNTYLVPFQFNPPLFSLPGIAVAKEAGDRSAHLLVRPVVGV